jgi:integrase
VVRGGTQDDRCGALYGPQARRTTRAAVAGRRSPRTAPERPPAVRPQRDHDAEEQSGAGVDPARPGRRRCARGAVPGNPVSGGRVDRVRASGARDTARPLEARTAREDRDAQAGVPNSFRPWHGLRHTALTETAAAGVPGMFVQAKAGHAHGSTTERYLHAQKTSYPDAAELAEARLFSSASRSISANNPPISSGS